MKRKKQRSHMNDCFKHGKVLYADQPQLVKWSSYDALQTYIFGRFFAELDGAQPPIPLFLLFRSY